MATPDFPVSFHRGDEQASNDTGEALRGKKRAQAFIDTRSDDVSIQGSVRGNREAALRSGVRRGRLVSVTRSVRSRRHHLAAMTAGRAGTTVRILIQAFIIILRGAKCIP